MQTVAARSRPASVKRAAAFLDWVRSYIVLWIVIAVGLVATFPGWYRESLLQSIMTNAFATFVVTPVLVFGVERVVRHVDETRERPRRAVALEEFAASLSGVVASLAAIRSINTVLPGEVERLAKGFPRPATVSDENAHFMTDALVADVLTRRSEVESVLARMSITDLATLMSAAAEQVPELRARLFEAGSAIHPAAHVRAVRLLQALHRIGRSAELAKYIADGGYRSPDGQVEVALHSSFEQQYLDAVYEAAQMYRNMPAA